MAWDPKDPPRFAGLKIDAAVPFADPIEFEFDPEVNVFIGPNATGKSTILKTLDCSPSQTGSSGLANISHIEKRGDWLVMRADWLPDIDEVNVGTVPFIYLPPAREGLPHSDKFFDRWPQKTDQEEEVDPHYVYGVEEIQQAQGEWERLIERAPALSFFVQVLGHEPSSDLGKFDYFDQFLVPVQKMRADDISGDRSRVVARVVERADACIRDIDREVVKGPTANYTHIRRSHGGAPSIADITQEVFLSGAILEAVGKDPIFFGDLSTGTQGLIGWIRYLALKMAEHYSFSEGTDADGRSYHWQDQPAILLIDEIENHLHPTWQRRVIPALRKHFPKLQIFATTHSPFVVAGLKRGQVHRLYREKGVIKTDQLTEEEKEHKLVGWTVEQILRKFMDVTDPTDEETAMAAATLRWLQGRRPPPEVSAAVWVQDCLQHLQDNHERDENETAALVWLTGRQQTEGDALATKNAVEWRAEVLGELRTLVSLDIEAGGPFAAQRERFTAQLRKLLAKDQTGSQDPDEEG